MYIFYLNANKIVHVTLFKIFIVSKVSRFSLLILFSPKHDTLSNFTFQFLDHTASHVALNIFQVDSGSEISFTFGIL